MFAERRKIIGNVPNFVYFCVESRFQYFEQTGLDIKYGLKATEKAFFTALLVKLNSHFNFLVLLGMQAFLQTKRGQ